MEKYVAWLEKVYLLVTTPADILAAMIECIQYGTGGEPKTPTDEIIYEDAKYIITDDGQYLYLFDKGNEQNIETLVSELYDLTNDQLMGLAVQIKEHPETVADIGLYRKAIEKILHIRHVERLQVYHYYHGRASSVIVRDNRSLKVAYEILGMMKSGELSSGDGAARMISLKCEIRRYVNRIVEGRRIVRDDGTDGYVELVQLPSCLDTAAKDEAEEWFGSYRTYSPIYSAFDCTGRPFTNWFKLLRRHNHWYAYHSVSFDV